MQKYQIIYADPPWMEQGGGRIKRGADKHYPLMKTKEIMAMNVPSAKNAHLYLWVTNNHLKDGLMVMEAWGFKYKTTITWAKDRFGIGQYYRGQTEHCLFGVKGNLPYKTIAGKRQQGTTLIQAKRKRHSEKPLEMIAFIEKVSARKGYKKLELFARTKRKTWDVWGNEVNNSIELSGIMQTPRYYRARIEALQTANSDIKVDENRKYFRNGFVPEDEREEFEKKIRFFEPNHNNEALTFAEITSYSTWFVMHPEKMAGKEVATSSRSFPVKLKGKKIDIEQMFAKVFPKDNEKEAEALAFALQLELELMKL